MEMGKSGKKVKSDRINTLRKQYDAFLEDDKKRRDRNEYILGRLEEMRSSSALVKIRQKTTSHVNDHYYNSGGIQNYFNDSPGIEDNRRTLRNKINISTDCIPQQFEPSILREITKNYILIPKRQSCISSDVKYNKLFTENTDADWKSKYDILNELKKREKETVPNTQNVILEERRTQSSDLTVEALNMEDNKINNNITLTDNLQNPNVNITNISNLNTNEKDILDATLDLNLYNNDEDTIQQKDSKENDQYSTSVNTHEMQVSHELLTEPKIELSTNKVYNNNFQNYDTSQEIKNTDRKKLEKQLKEKRIQETVINETLMQQNKPEEYFEQEVKEKNIRIKDNTETIVSHELTNNSDSEISERLQESLKNQIEIEPELNSIQNYKSNEDTIISNPVLNNIENYESNEDPVINKESANAEVSGLENEQDQMFYTDNSEKKYEYEESNMDPLPYSTENENYTNIEYSYHTESQQDQPYASEINEHEESTERYDPNYEQQYTDNYENVMNVPQYDNQQYEVDNSYEIQQDPLVSNGNYEEVQPNNENFENVPSENTEISYQNQEENVYNFRNENYEAQQYDTNQQQEYSTNPNDQDQYAVEQVYIQMNTEQETLKDMEKGLDSEDGYINNQNTNLTDNTEKPNVTDVSPDKIESNLNVS